MGGRITLIQRFCGLWRHPMDFKWHYNKKKNAMRMYSRSIVVWGILTNLESNFTLPLIPKCPLIHKLTKHTLMIYIKWASFWYFRYCNIVMQSFVQCFPAEPLMQYVAKTRQTESLQATGCPGGTLLLGFYILSKSVEVDWSAAGKKCNIEINVVMQIWKSMLKLLQQQLSGAPLTFCLQHCIIWASMKKVKQNKTDTAP